MRLPEQPSRVVMTFACPPDRFRPVILALVAMTLVTLTLAVAVAGRVA